MCFPLFPVHVLFWFLVHRAPKRQRIYRAKFFVFFGTIDPYTKFELLMSITFLRNPLFEMKKVMAVHRSCARAVPVSSYATHCSPPRNPHIEPGVPKLSAGRRATGLLRSATAIGDGSLLSLR